MDAPWPYQNEFIDPRLLQQPKSNNWDDVAAKCQAQGTIRPRSTKHPRSADTIYNSPLAKSVDPIVPGPTEGHLQPQCLGNVRGSFPGLGECVGLLPDGTTSSHWAHCFGDVGLRYWQLSDQPTGFEFPPWSPSAADSTWVSSSDTAFPAATNNEPAFFSRMPNERYAAALGSQLNLDSRPFDVFCPEKTLVTPVVERPREALVLVRADAEGKLRKPEVPQLPYKCPSADCPRSFKRKGDRNRHFTRHIAVATIFVCPIEECPRQDANVAFPRKDKLMDHVVAAHKIPRSEVGAVINLPWTRSGDEYHKCPMKHCQQIFTAGRSELRSLESSVHLVNVHGASQDEAYCFTGHDTSTDPARLHNRCKWGWLTTRSEQGLCHSTTIRPEYLGGWN